MNESSTITLVDGVPHCARCGAEVTSATSVPADFDDLGRYHAARSVVRTNFPCGCSRREQIEPSKEN